MLRVDFADVCDTGFCCLDRGFGALVAVVVGAQLIHTDAADEGALAFGETDIGEKVRGFDVDGGVVAGCCCSVGKSAVDDAGVDALGLC